MNLSKWMSWRKRNFFRRKEKPESSSLDLGKWMMRTSVVLSSVEEFNNEFKDSLQEAKLFIHLTYKVISHFIFFSGWNVC